MLCLSQIAPSISPCLAPVRSCYKILTSSIEEQTNTSSVACKSSKLSAFLPLIFPIEGLNDKHELRGGYEPVSPNGLHDLVQVGADFSFDAQAC